MATNGKQSINQIVMDFLKTGDLSAFNETMEESTRQFLSQTEKTLNKMGDIPTNGRTISMSSHYESYTKGSATDAMMQRLNKEKRERQKILKEEAERAKAEQAQKSEGASSSAGKKSYPAKGDTGILVPFKNVGDSSSVLCTVAGGIGLAASMLSLLRTLWRAALGSFSLGSVIFGAVMCIGFGCLLNYGISKKNILEKAKRFAYLCGQKKYIDIDDLSSSVNQTVKKTVRDIKRMLKAGYFPEGHLDNDKTTLILSDSVYEEYLRSLNGRKSLKESAKEAVDTTAKDVTGTDKNPELTKLINDGNAYISTLHKLNDEIPGEEISAKLGRLETLLGEIFRCVEKHPEQMDRMHEVMDYYIPTVIKLVEAYKEYDSLTEAGKDILDAKHQIECSIDTVNEALKKIINNLFRDSVWDVTTDASVLNTMLAQKGLASPFAGKGENNE